MKTLETKEMVSEFLKEFYGNVGLTDARFYPDPECELVWKVENARIENTMHTVIAYLPGSLAGGSSGDAEEWEQ